MLVFCDKFSLSSVSQDQDECDSHVNGQHWNQEHDEHHSMNVGGLR